MTDKGGEVDEKVCEASDLSVLCDGYVTIKYQSTYQGEDGG